MPVPPARVVDELVRMGYQPREPESNRKVSLLRPRGGGSVVYVATDNREGTSAVRIHPDLEAHVNALLADGVRFEGERFHSGMREFPKRLNKGMTENHYGLAFTFESVTALRGFVERLAQVGRTPSQPAPGGST